MVTGDRAGVGVVRAVAAKDAPATKPKTKDALAKFGINMIFKKLVMVRRHFLSCAESSIRAVQTQYRAVFKVVIPAAESLANAASYARFPTRRRDSKRIGWAKPIERFQGSTITLAFKAQLAH